MYKQCVKTKFCLLNLVSFTIAAICTWLPSYLTATFSISFFLPDVHKSTPTFLPPLVTLPLFSHSANISSMPLPFSTSSFFIPCETVTSSRFLPLTFQYCMSFLHLDFISVVIPSNSLHCPTATCPISVFRDSTYNLSYISVFRDSFKPNLYSFQLLLKDYHFHHT